MAFPYAGGKNSKLNDILPLLPLRDVYIEPCGGSLGVLLNRPISKIEHANDIDESVVNAWEVIRERKDEFIEKLRWTPYAHSEFERCRDMDVEDPLEKARRFFVSVDQSFSNTRTRSWRSETHTVHKQFDEHVERMLERVRLRLRKVYFHCRPASEIIQMKDSERAVIYVDPPYVKASRVAKTLYIQEMGDDEHRELARVLGNAKSTVVVSGYRNDLYDELYEGWESMDFKAYTGNTHEGRRVETLWFNFKPNTLM